MIVHDTIYRDVTCYSCLDSAWQVKKNTLDSLWIEAVKEVDLYRAEVFAQVEAKKAEYQLLKEANFNGNMIILGDTLHNADVSFGFDGKPKITVK